MKIEDTSFTGKHALIVGGTSGIGKDTALALGRIGAKVTVLGRRFKDMESIDPEWKALSGFQGIGVDLYDFQAVESMMREIEARNQPFDYLVNSAGLFSPKPFLEHSRCIVGWPFDGPLGFDLSFACYIESGRRQHVL